MTMQAYEPVHDPLVFVRPACPECNLSEMWLARIEPTDWDGLDKRTFECPRCQCSCQRLVRYK